MVQTKTGAASETEVIKGTLLCVVGISTLWQAFRRPTFGSALSLCGIGSSDAMPMYMLLLALAVVAGAAVLPIVARSGRPRAYGVLAATSLLPAAAVGSGALLGAPASMAFVVAAAFAVPVGFLTVAWARVVTGICRAGGCRGTLACLFLSGILGFLFTAFDETIAYGNLVMCLVALPISCVCLLLLQRLAHGEVAQDQTSCGEQRAVFGRFAAPGSWFLLTLVTAVMFVAAIPANILVFAEAGDARIAVSLSMRHYAVLGELIVMLVVAVTGKTPRKTVYLLWVLTAGLFLVGLMLMKAGSVYASAFGSVLVYSGGRVLEPLLLATVVLDMAEKDGRLWEAVALFLLPQALAHSLACLGVPAGQPAGFGGVSYADLLAQGLAAVFLACLLTFLIWNLFKNADAGDTARTVGAEPSEGAVVEADSSPEGICERYGLSAREDEIVRMVVRGYTAERIAELTGISVGTVRTHSKNAYRKLGVHTRQELIDLVEGFQG